MLLEVLRIEKRANVRGANKKDLRKATRGALRASSDSDVDGDRRLCTCCPGRPVRASAQTGRLMIHQTGRRG